MDLKFDQRLFTAPGWFCSQSIVIVELNSHLTKVGQDVSFSQTLKIEKSFLTLCFITSIAEAWSHKTYLCNGYHRFRFEQLIFLKKSDSPLLINRTFKFKSMNSQNFCKLL